MHCTVEVLLAGRETLEDVLADSPRLKKYLDTFPEVRLIDRRWSGVLRKIPSVRNCLVHCSDNIFGSMSDLTQECMERGHVLFYCDHLITFGHRYSAADLIATVHKLLELHDRLYAKQLKKESSTPSDE